MPDEFNNPSNDYVDPGLAPCAGTSDSYTFKFLPKKDVGIVSGSNIIQQMDLSDIIIPVTGWIEEKKTIESGEVIYVPGLEKGLLNRTQVFDISAGVYPTPTSSQGDPKYFMAVDFSINFYYNFRYYNINVEASANYATSLDIKTAIDSALDDVNAIVTCTFDPIDFTFIGDTAGWDYDITNLVLTITDSSTDSFSPWAPWTTVDGERIPRIYTLNENEGGAIVAQKYPNGGMLGYLLKATYPSTAGENDKWVYTNNVESPFIIYEPIITVSTGNITVGTNTIFDVSENYFITDLSIGWPGWDVSIDGIANWDVSVGDVSIGTIDASFWTDPSILYLVVDNSIVLPGTWIQDSSITDSSISNSFVKSSYINSSDNFSTITDSSILNTTLIRTSLWGSIMQGGYFYNDTSTTTLDGSIGNSVLKWTDVSGGFIYDSKLDGSILSINTLNEATVNDSSVSNYNSVNTNFINTWVFDSSSIATGSINGGSIFDSSIGDSSINDASIYSSSVYDTSAYGSNGDNVYFARSHVVDSKFKGSIFNNDTSIIDSYIFNSWTNAYLTTPTLWINDASSYRMSIQTSNIWDTSINNATVTDTSIYTSFIDDSSLIRCTIYNTIDSSTSTYVDCMTIQINATFDASENYTQDASTYYEKKSKKVDVGMSGSGTATVLSAAEYLYYINSNNRWNKVGPFVAQISCDDPAASSVKNLLGGFYVFNPHDFQVQVEYMLINT